MEQHPKVEIDDGTNTPLEQELPSLGVFTEEPQFVRSGEAEEIVFTEEPEVADGKTEDEDNELPVFDLKRRHAELLAEQVLELRVPRWDGPEIWLQLTPLVTTKIPDIFAECRDKYGEDEYLIKGNALIMVRCCKGVYGKHGNRKFSLRKDDPNGPYTRVDEDLARALGFDTKNSVDTLIKLYLTDGDLLAAASALTEWSGKASQTADQAF